MQGWNPGITGKQRRNQKGPLDQVVPVTFHYFDSQARSGMWNVCALQLDLVWFCVNVLPFAFIGSSLCAACWAQLPEGSMSSLIADRATQAYGLWGKQPGLKAQLHVLRATWVGASDVPFLHPPFL